MRICVATGSSQPQQQQQKQQQQQPQQQLARVTVIKDFEYLIMKMSEANVFLLRRRWQCGSGAVGQRGGAMTGTGVISARTLSAVWV